jgi:hypothetical protein
MAPEGETEPGVGLAFNGLVLETATKRRLLTRGDTSLVDPNAALEIIAGGDPKLFASGVAGLATECSCTATRRLLAAN